MIHESKSNGAGSKSNGHDRSRNLRAVALGIGPSSEPSLRDIYRICFRHQRKVVTIFTLTMLIVAGYAVLCPKTYRSEAKLYVRLGRENVGLDPTTTLGQSAVVAVPPSREEELNTVVEVLGSRNLLDKVVDAVGPAAILSPLSWRAGDASGGPQAAASTATAGENNPGWLESLGLRAPVSDRERAVTALHRQIRVEVVRKTNLLLVSHEGRNPQVSKLIVSKLIDCFLEEHGRINRSPRAHQFLAQQAAALKAQVNGLENDLRLLKEKTGLAAPTEQRQILVTQIGRLQDELKSAQANSAAAEAEMRALASRLTGLKQTQTLTHADDVPNMAADGMRQQLYTLQLKEKELASRQTDRNVELKLVRAQIASAKAVLDAVPASRPQTTTGPNRTYEELRLTQLRRESELASLRSKEKALVAQLTDSQQQLGKLNSSELRIAQLGREIQIRESSYRKYAEGLEQSRIDESLEQQRISNINVAQPPTAGVEPVWPKTRLTLFLGLVFAVLGAVGSAFAVEYFDHTFKTADDIESRLKLPVLVSIPQMRSGQMAHSIHRG